LTLFCFAHHNPPAKKEEVQYRGYQVYPFVRFPRSKTSSEASPLLTLESLL
jgi:hypothetical protein